MGDEAVKEQACNRCRKDIDRQFLTDEKRLNAHSEDIQDLKMISNKLTQLQEIQTKQLENMEKRIADIEQQNQVKQGFYNSDVFKWVVKALIVMAVMLVGAAIGHNIDVKNILGGN